MLVALTAYLDAVRHGGRHYDGVMAAAQRVSDRPWDVVMHAGRLARCVLDHAGRDIGLTDELRVCRPGSRRALVEIPKGAPYPVPRHAGRRSRGAFDTPVEMARRVVAASLQGSHAVRSGIDPACGTGAFLLAMHEAGVREVHGTDIDPLALAVARIAVPEARIERRDALTWDPVQVDLVVGNPPFVPPERQDKELRVQLRRRFPWLHGRFDLVIPFASVSVSRCREGGVVGLVLPAAALSQPYGSVLRRRWLERHRFLELSGPHPFPGASVEVYLIVMEKGAGPAPVPAFGVPAEDLTRLPNVPLNPDLMPGDVALIEHVRARSVRLGDLCEVDTGVVAHGPSGGKKRLLHDSPGEGRVPYADARDYFAGRRRWLSYQPDQMHRAKRPELFEGPKIVVQRLRGQRPVRAAIDLDGVYVGHTCTVVRPLQDRVGIERLLALITSPLIDGLSRIEGGRRIDLYPRDVAGFPVPECWLDDSTMPLHQAFGLDAEQVERLEHLAC